MDSDAYDTVTTTESAALLSQFLNLNLDLLQIDQGDDVASQQGSYTEGPQWTEYEKAVIAHEEQRVVRKRRERMTAASLALLKIVAPTFSVLHSINHSAESKYRPEFYAWEDNPSNLSAAGTIVPHMVTKTNAFDALTDYEYGKKLDASFKSLQTGDLHGFEESLAELTSASEGVRVWAVTRAMAKIGSR